MTEEINYSYDGGIYAELVRDRTPATPGRAEQLAHSGARQLRGECIGRRGHWPSAALTRSLRVTVSAATADSPRS